MRDEAEELQPEYRVHKDDHREERRHVEQRWEREHERHEQAAQLLCTLEQPEQPQDTHEAHHPEQKGWDRQHCRERLVCDLVEQ